MATKEKLFEKLLASLDSYPKEEVDFITNAYNFAEDYHTGQSRASGEEFIIHPISVAINLANMNVDYEMICAGLLHDVVEDTNVTLDDIKNKFGENIAMLVDGVTKISKLKPSSKKERKAETIRKMLLAMIKDMKIIVIKLADKMHNMKTLNFLPLEKRKRIAKETLDIYAPLAGKIGMHFIKDELEDLALKWLYPDVFEIIQQYFDRTEKDIARTISLVSRTLSEKLEENSIPFTVKSRKKHYYSIFRKMKKYNKKIEEIFDLYGIRLITDTTTNCYQIFGIIHNIWQPIPGRFRDFIANPKKNGYRSLHTTVIVEKRKAIEIQIRTNEMDEYNEYGVAAHWYYKKGHNPTSKNLKWLKKLLEVHKQTLSAEEYYQILRDDILKDEIYVFSPKGDIHELPKGATPIDFAYRIHTEIGHRCKGAKANGIIMPLNSTLKNGMVVEIITSKISNPKQSWLSFVKTQHAKKKIRSWLAANRREETQTKKQEEETKKEKPPIKEKKENDSSVQQDIQKAKITVQVDGEKNLLFTLAKCCSPTPPDPIIGYISRGKGITIHKKDCNELKHMKEIKERTIEVNWSEK